MITVKKMQRNSRELQFPDQLQLIPRHLPIKSWLILIILKSHHWVRPSIFIHVNLKLKISLDFSCTFANCLWPFYSMSIFQFVIFQLFLQITETERKYMGKRIENYVHILLDAFDCYAIQMLQLIQWKTHFSGSGK